MAYPDTLRKELADTYKAEPLVYVKNYGQKEVDTDFSGPMGFFKLMQAMMGGTVIDQPGRGKKIAVVYAVGPIMTGKSESDPFGGKIWARPRSSKHSAKRTKTSRSWPSCCGSTAPAARPWRAT